VRTAKEAAVSPLDRIRALGLEPRQLRLAAAICRPSASHKIYNLIAIAHRRFYADLYQDEAEILEMLRQRSRMV